MKTFFSDLRKSPQKPPQHWSLVLVAILVSFILNGALPACASDLRIAAEAAATKAFTEQKELLLLLKTDKKLGEHLKLIRQLSFGFVRNPTNPLKLDNSAEAIASLQVLISTTSDDDKFKVEKVLFELLKRSNVKSDVEKAAVMLAKQPLLVDGPFLSFDTDVTKLDSKQVADLKLRLQQGLPLAAFMLADFYEKSRPAAAKTYREQGVYLATLNAQSSPSAAMFLASIYIDGRAGTKDAAKAMEAFALAVSNGSNSALTVMDSHFDDLAFVDLRPQMKALIENALISGSDLAAEMLILDQADTLRYGFEEEDALWALALLNEIKSPRAIYVNAKLFAEGRLVVPDMRKADELLAQMSDVSAYVGEYQFAIGRRILNIDMPSKYYYTHALPIFLGLINSEKKGAINRVASLINMAMREGYFASTKELPVGADTLVAKLTQSYAAGDWVSGLILGDIFEQGLVVSANVGKAHQYYNEVSEGSQDPALAVQADEALTKMLRRNVHSGDDNMFYIEKLKALADRDSLWAKKEYGSLLLDNKGITSNRSEEGVALLFHDVEKDYFSASSRILKYATLNKREDLLQRLTGMLEHDYTNNPSRAVTIELAQVYGATGKPDAALDLLKRFNSEDDPEAIFMISKISMDAKKIPRDMAIAEVKRAISLTAPTNIQLVKYARYILTEKKKDGFIDVDALDIVSSFADRGNSDAIALALKYMMPDMSGHSDRLIRAISWVTKEAQDGRPDLLLALSDKQLGKAAGQENNIKLVKSITDNMDKMGDRGSARNILAIAYRNGFGVAVDLDKAKSYSLQAAALGNPSALFDIGTTYLYGIGVQRSVPKAETLLGAASLFNSNRALIADGRLNGAAFGSTFSEFQAFAKNQEAAEAGSLAGMIETGRAYMAGAGVEKDVTAGLTWLEKAAGKGSPFAASQLYFYYAVQAPSVQNGKARYWLDKAIAFGHSPSLVRKAALLNTEDSVGNATEVQALLDQSIAEGQNLSRRYKAKIEKDRLK